MMITLNNSTQTLTPSIQSNSTSPQRENQNTDLRVDQQVNRTPNVRSSSSQQESQQSRAESEDKRREVNNTQDASKQVLNQLEILNEKQSQASDPRERQNLIRSFNDLASRLQSDSRLEEARTEFNPNDPEQTRQVIKQAQERLNNQDNQQLIASEGADDNTASSELARRARESVTQAVNNQENTRVQILTPQERKQEPEQPFIDAPSEQTQGPQQQQQENPFGRIS